MISRESRKESIPPALRKSETWNLVGRIITLRYICLREAAKYLSLRAWWPSELFFSILRRLKKSYFFLLARLLPPPPLLSGLDTSVATFFAASRRSRLMSYSNLLYKWVKTSWTYSTIAESSLLYLYSYT